MEARRVLVSGCVQGVGFRYFVVDEARALGLAGFVRNLRDGRVEAEVSGPADKVEALIAACRRGRGRFTRSCCRGRPKFCS